MSSQKYNIYLIIINTMIEEELVFNWDIAKGSYGWSKASYYNFLQFVKGVKCFEVRKVEGGYALKVKR